MKILCTLAMVWLCTAAAVAQPGTIKLSNGEVATGEVTALVLGEQVTLQLADGSQRVVPWHSIVSIELAPAAAPSAAEPVVAPAVVAPAVVAPPVIAPPALPPMDPSRRILELRDEIDALRDSRPSALWPVVVMAGGLTVGLTGFALGIAFAATNAAVEHDRERAQDLGIPTNQTAYEKVDTTACFVVGTIATTVGIAGFTWLLSSLGERSKINNVIRSRQRELDSLELDVRGGPSAAAATMRLRF